MSVIICAPNGYHIVRKTVEHLRRQTAVDQLELIIMTPSLSTLDTTDSDLGCFYQTSIYEADTNKIAQTRSIAVQKALSPIVVFAEDHSFPEPRWAEAMIHAHKGPWAAVGPVVCNANPGNVNSWAQYFMTYGRWSEPIESDEIDDLPGHNSSYKKEFLLQYDDELHIKLLREYFLHRDLRQRGYKLYLESRARTHHINVSIYSSILSDMYTGGRLFAAAQVLNDNWSPSTRLFRALYEPLVMFRYFLSILKNTKRSGKWKDLYPKFIPILVSGVSAHLFGKIVGYIFGLGNSEYKAHDFEFNRSKHITDSDKDLLKTSY